MAACSPSLRNGSSTSCTADSSASRPSRRAFSASLTTVSTVPSAVIGLASSAIFSAAIERLKSLSRPPAMPAPSVPTKTRISGGMGKMAIGLPPSRIIVTKIAAKATTMPISVAGSMSGPPVGPQRDGVGEDVLVTALLRLGVLLRGGRQVLGQGDDGRPVGQHALGEQLDRLRDDVLGAVDEGDHRVGRGFGLL